MDKIIELSANEVRQLLAELNHANSKSGFGIRGLRVCIEGDTAKFKVNEWMWSPPMGHLDPACSEAERRQAQA